MKKGCLITIGVLFFIFVIAIIGAALSPDEGNDSSSTEQKEQIGNVEKKDAETKWTYSENIDEMTEKKTFFASLTSDNKVDFDFPYEGGSSLSINVRQSPKYGKDVYFTISKGQFTDIFNGSISVKFDNGSIEKYSCSGASDADTGVLFLSGNVDKFIKKLKEAKQIKVQASFFQEGDRTFTFTTPVGLEWKH
ncbi:MAG: hypothetical protein ILP23_03770 [Paludibacteraceae bacterium]|nr:hypothetical protein [Paludibacteraceae bacterium]